MSKHDTSLSPTSEVTTTHAGDLYDPPRTFMGRLIEGVIHQRLAVLVLATLLTCIGLAVAPFDVPSPLPKNAVAVDAIPDIGENQQIIHIQWPGRSPKDIDDQLTYPISSALMGVAGVSTIRSSSMLGSSSIYVIFDEHVEYYWSRTRLQEALTRLSSDASLPPDASLALGPDATALGQIYWYTLEGQDEDGKPAGSWDLHTLRSLQDYRVRYALQELPGVAEVAAIGGHVKALVVEPDVARLRAYGIGLPTLLSAVEAASAEVGGGTMERHGAEYILRSEGFARSIEDIEQAWVPNDAGAPLRIDDLARVSYQPRDRDGFLDKNGREAVGGIVIARHGSNPMEVAQQIHRAVDDLNASLPFETLPDGRRARVQIVPYLDRATLVDATIATLEDSLSQSILITIVVVLLMMGHLRSSMLISSLLPLAVLWTFVVMKIANVSANVVALAGIAIAIGTMVDLGIVLTENVVERVRTAKPGIPLRVIIAEATAEVSAPLATALATTALSFLPVFFLEGAEGKLFGPLAFTKTWALVLSFVIAMLILPLAAWYLLDKRWDSLRLRAVVQGIVALASVYLIVRGSALLGGLFLALAAAGLFSAALDMREHPYAKHARTGVTVALAVSAILLLGTAWAPLGHGAGTLANGVFTLVVVGGLLGTFRAFERAYPRLLQFFLRKKSLFLAAPVAVVCFGLLAWQGAPRIAAPLPAAVQQSAPVRWLGHVLPGFGREFMPNLDEGAFLYMPTTAPHASIGEIQRISALLTTRLEAIPEVATAVTKAGRASTALDPAPLSMLETVINYRPEFIEDSEGRRRTFAVARDGSFRRDAAGDLIPDDRGRPFRQWRDHIRSADDIWNEVVHAADIPGLTGAPLLQPISARVVMLQSGIRASTAIRVRGADLDAIYEAARLLEARLREHPKIQRQSVVADRTAGRPYIVIRPQRDAMADAGITMADLQRSVESALAGTQVATLYEGRERYAISVRLPRDDRGSVEAIEALPLQVASGAVLRLGELATITYELGPMMTNAENGRLVTWVMFGGQAGVAEVDLVEQLQRDLQADIDSGLLTLPAGVSFDFVGSYANAQRATARLAVLIPMAILIIFVLLHMQLRSVVVTLIVFSGVVVAGAGGMTWMWIYNQANHAEFQLAGINFLDIFHIVPTQLSVAVWVGFIALCGIATDDGVVIASWLQTAHRERPAATVSALHAQVLDVGKRRIRACLMTTATTILALLPVLTSSGTGADVMIPMAIPLFGGMLFALMTLFVVPVLYTAWRERTLPLVSENV